MESIKTVSGHIIDIEHRRIFKGTITVQDGFISSIIESEDVPDQFILPGFIDAHIHIESSMVTPFEFAKVALGHGTVATVSDPHEIANVCGLDGIKFMLVNAKNAGLKFFFGAPSCVPATIFENSGATINSGDIDYLLSKDDIWYLSEMMNYPGVLHDDDEIIAKLNSAKKYNKPIDGHAPGLTGTDAINYINHGITTDHECFTYAEAEFKLNHGMKIIIREGSAAKNFEALHPLIGSSPSMVMFCSDDKHPDDLIVGHINLLVKRALALGYDFFEVLKIACINPVKHYNLPVGLLKKGDKADFIIIDDTKEWKVNTTIIDGNVVFKNNAHLLPEIDITAINNFNATQINADKLQYKAVDQKIPVINAIDGSLITEKSWAEMKNTGGYFISQPEDDILKICVVNRYEKNAKISIGFSRNFGLKNCAIASTVAHDSHNIVAVGSDDILLTRAINLIIDSKGGLSAVSNEAELCIPLPIAGLMSDKSVDDIGEKYRDISNFVKMHGCPLRAPFMTLSFMALLVIPKIKISDLGMFDAENFSFY